MTKLMRRPVALLILILLTGMALRLVPYGQNRFLEDEALYGYWGLQIASGADPMLDQEPVDKPPLHAYTLALGFLALGQGEAPARVPSLLASVAGIALVYALGRALYADAAVGLLAALLLALSPFDLLFASTAFTDPLMTAWVLGALLAAARGHPGTAGLLAGLAAATKQQGLFFLPLVVGVVALAPAAAHARPQASQRRAWPAKSSRWLRLALGFAAVAGAVTWWDLARVQRPGFFAQSLISYGGLGPAQPQALGQRALAWLELLADFWGGGLAALLAAVLAALLVATRIRSGRRPATGWTRADGLLAGFLLAFLALHWLVGFQVWDRYLLGLVPLAALLAARLLAGAARLAPAGRWRTVAAATLGVLLAAGLARPVVLAANSELPLGGDHGAYDGIDHLADYIRAEAPPGAVLYHFWLGSHYRFYLYGAPLRLHWYPDAADLVHDATVYRREPRYIAFPSFRDNGPALAALDGAGIELAPIYQTRRRDGTVSFRLYRLEGPD